MSKAIGRFPNRGCAAALAAVGAVLPGLGACGGDAPVEPPPDAPRWVTLVPDSARLTYIGERARFQVRLGRDPELLSGSVVRWSSTDTSVFTVDGDGEVTARGNGLAELVAEYRPHIRDSAPVRVEQETVALDVLGDGQRAGAGLALPGPVGVRLFDAGGTVVAWPTRVRFEVGEGSGSADPAEALSDSLGAARTVWTMGAVPGAGVLAASVGDGPGAEIGATVLARDGDVARVVAHAGGEQWAPAGETLAEPVVVRLVDAAGGRVPGASVRFEPARGHGTVEPAEAVSDIEGLAATTWTLGEEPGPQTLVAAASAGASVEVAARAQSDEGVCARTPAVADALVARIGVAGCADVTEAQLAAMGWLDLGNLGIPRLGSGDFAGLKALTRLDLSGNELAELPPGIFAGLPQLELLFLRNNRLAALPPGVFAGLGRLRSLWLHGNELAELPPGIFGGLPELRELLLHRNRLEALPPDVFAGLSSLVGLYLENNRLSELPPDIFAGLTKLDQLYLDENDLVTVPAGVFGDLSSLRRLSLRDNSLASLPPGVFDGLSRLEVLVLYANGINHLPPSVFDDLERLVELDLGGVFLDDLPPGAFAGKPNLEVLNLEINDLTELRPGVFAGLRKLRYLALRSNELTELPPGVFAGLGSLETFWAQRNPGAPFPILAEFERVDAEDMLAPGPARVVMRVPHGAPFAFRMPVSVQRGTASAGWLEVGAGDTASAPLVVERPSGRTDAVHLSFGQAPGLPTTYAGIEVVGGDQVALFADTDNRSPVFRAQLPPHWMQAGSEPAGLELAPYFSDPDGDSLVYGVESSDPSVAVGRIEAGTLWFEGLAEGEAAVEVTATDPEGLMASQRMGLTVLPPADPDRFNIHLFFDGGFSDRHKEAARRAADRWEEVVVGDLPEVPIDGYLDDCGYDTGRRLVGTVDDLVIQMHSNSKGFVSNPDLSIAGTCGRRAGSGLAFHGAVWYSTSRFRPGYNSWDSFQRLTLHEIGHVLGIGSRRWSVMLKKTDDTPPDRYFPGPLAIAAFNEAGGLAYDGNRVPVQTTGLGQGTHWRYNVLRGELMGSGGYALSAITVQALADMGHVVDVTRADAYTLPGLGSAAGAVSADDGSGGEEFVHADSVLQLPVVVVDSTGKVVRVIRN